MEVIAELDEFPTDLFTPMHVELNSFESVRSFHKEVRPPIPRAAAAAAAAATAAA